MNSFLIIAFVSIGLAIIGGYALSEITAQVEVEGFTEEDKTVSFNRFQFVAYFLASDLGDGNNFLNNVEAQRVQHTLKSLPIKTRVLLYCTDDQVGEIYMVQGAYVFKRSVDASEVKDWVQNNLPLNKIRFAEFYLLDNTHHWDNPQPDNIIVYKQFGNEQQFDQVSNRCLS